MGKKLNKYSIRERQIIAQEAARIIVGHGIHNYSHAKQKAAHRLNMSSSGSLPSNEEIEVAIAEQLQIFNAEDHINLLEKMRTTALVLMQAIEDFSPRLVGSVLKGTSDKNSKINIHAFIDSPELLAIKIHDMSIKFKSYDRKLRTFKKITAIYPGFEFSFNDERFQVTVFPYDGIRQAPISPIDGKPMQRADIKALRKLLKIE
mgnify:FL=1|jgi:hypothetical protein